MPTLQKQRCHMDVSPWTRWSQAQFLIAVLIFTARSKHALAQPVKPCVVCTVISEAGACLVIAGGNFEKSGGDLG